MDVVVDCYGVAARLSGGAQHVVRVPPGARVADALVALAARWPELGAILPACACAIGDAVARRDHALRAGERLALLPPVSGG